MHTIANFGKNTVCMTEDEVVSCLRAKYAGQSVSVHTTLLSGITHTTFVDVPKDSSKQLMDSYSGKPFFVDRQ